MKLVYEDRGEMGYMTLTNPPQNTLVDPVFENQERLASFLDTPSFRAVIAKGAGRHFSAGADLATLEAHTKPGSLEFEEKLRLGKNLLHTISFASIPVVAVIRGSCLGAGLEIALSCHFRFAARNALIGFPESEHGLLPGLGGTSRAPNVLGVGRAIELLLSGKMVNGEEALDLGIVDQIFDTKDVEEEAIKFTKRLVERRSPRVIRAVMTAINNGRTLPKEEALAKETELFCMLARRRDE